MPPEMNVCTIIAKNYTAFARVLGASLREHHLDATLTVLVLDDFDGYLDTADEPFEVLTPQDIGCAAFDLMVDRYTLLELSTAVKPWLLRTLLQREGVDHAIYLDPDIHVVGALDSIAELAAQNDIVVTPHTMSPIPRDGLYPQEQSLLIAGAYNLGFIALGTGLAAHAMLDWWQERLERDCTVDVANGLFVDQKWIDLVPGLWPGTHLLTDPGCNVAYWNYHERVLSTAEDGRLQVNGQPARFLHFSGFTPLESGSLSKYQNRVDLTDRNDIRLAAEAYGQALLDAGFEETTRWPYVIERLDIGSRDPSDIPGVNVVGYLTAELGVGEVGRQIIGALDGAGAPVTPITIPSGTNREQHAFDHRGVGGPLQPVNLLCVNADMLPEVVDSLGAHLFEHRRTVGFWWWETEAFPYRWRPSFDLVDEVWVGSEFVANALSLVSSKPVVRIPTPVTVPADTQPDRSRLGLPDGFLFLFVFDFNSVEKRKNPRGLIEAYLRAFPEPSADTSLVLKTVNGERHPHAFSEMIQTAGDRADIIVIDRYLSAADRDALVASCDCYASLHRSEGFGLTVAEAMLLGKPVIATAYGGVTDFVTEETAFPVRYERVLVGEGAAPYAPDESWAEPDLDHAAEAMRTVVADPGLAAARAANGRDFVRQHHSPAAAGEAMAERLRHLGAHSGTDDTKPTEPPADAPELPDAMLARTQTLELLRERPAAAPSGPRGAVQRLLRRISRGEADVRRKADEALWWSIEASSVVNIERNLEAVQTVQRQEKELLALQRELKILRAELDDVRASLGRVVVQQREARTTSRAASARTGTAVGDDR